MNAGTPSCRRKRARETTFTACAAPIDTHSKPSISKKARQTRLAKPATSAASDLTANKSQVEPNSKSKGKPQGVSSPQLPQAARACTNTKTLGVTDPQPRPNKAKGPATQRASGT